METLELKNVTIDVKDFNRWLNNKAKHSRRRDYRRTELNTKRKKGWKVQK